LPSLRVQLHVHTTASRGTRIKYDSTITPQEAIKVLYEKRVDAVAVTDHNTTRAYKEMKQLGERKGIHVIRGIEIDTTEGHLIGLGVDEEIEKHLSKPLTAAEAAELITDLCGEVYIPHPFDILRKGLGVKIASIDGIVEVFNPMNLFWFENELARTVASRLGRPMAVGSDAHSPKLLGSCINILDSELDTYSILKHLKKGEARFEKCRPISVGEMKEWALEKIILSRGSIEEKLEQGWGVDANYMIVANNTLMRKLERVTLETGARRPYSRVWDVVALMAYTVAAFIAKMREEEYRSQI